MSARTPLCGKCDNGRITDPETTEIIGRCPCRFVGASGDEQRDEALTATAEANRDAMRAALAIIRETALSAPVFNSNDTRPRMKLAQVPGQVVGAAFRQAIKDRAIRRIGYVPSTDVGTHAHPVAEYESLIYRAKAAS